MKTSLPGIVPWTLGCILLLAPSGCGGGGGGGGGSGGTTLAPPGGLTATASPSDVTVSWNPVVGSTSFHLYWSTTPGVTRANGTKVTGATSPWVHTGVTQFVTYHYVVTTVRNQTEGVESVEVSATPFSLTGTLDPTFGPGPGFFVHHDAAGGGGDDLAAGIAVTADDELVVTGRSMSPSSNFDMAVWLLDDAGVLVPTYGTGGVLTHDGAGGGNGWDQGTALLVDPFSRVVVAGITGNGLDSDMAVWRLK